MVDELSLWLEYSEADYETARFLYDKQYPRQLEIICYHCQQASEKIIKALYLAANIPGGIPHKHDLGFLLNQLSGRIDIPDDVADAAADLETYAIIVRYPRENRVDDYYTRKAMRDSKKVMDWAKDMIRSISDEVEQESKE